MRNIKLIIEYDGTGYHGWQSQTNAKAVQDVVTRAINKLTGEECKLIGSSRTDVGVHALGLTANFQTNSSIPFDKFNLALNSILPEDIVVKSSQEVPIQFHSRFNAKGKRYRYLINNSNIRSALLRNRAYHVQIPLDHEKMKRAAGYFLGKHDFSAFMAAGSSVVSTERTITSVMLEKDNEIITFEIEGDGFLYNMVRIIAGTLVYVGMGKLNEDDIPMIIKSKDRKKAGKTAPAHGLYLLEVYY